MIGPGVRNGRHIAIVDGDIDVGCRIVGTIIHRDLERQRGRHRDARCCKRSYCRHGCGKCDHGTHGLRPIVRQWIIVGIRACRCIERNDVAFADRHIHTRISIGWRIGRTLRRVRHDSRKWHVREPGKTHVVHIPAFITYEIVRSNAETNLDGLVGKRRTRVDGNGIHCRVTRVCVAITLLTIQWIRSTGVSELMIIPRISKHADVLPGHSIVLGNFDNAAIPICNGARTVVARLELEAMLERHRHRTSTDDQTGRCPTFVLASAGIVAVGYGIAAIQGIRSKCPFGARSHCIGGSPKRRAASFKAFRR